MNTNYYQILGVEPNVSEEIIWKKFNKIDEDLDPNDEDDLKKIAKIYESYVVLSDSETKWRYDRYLFLEITQHFRFSIDVENYLQKVSNELKEKYEKEEKMWKKFIERKKGNVKELREENKKLTKELEEIREKKKWELTQ